MIPDLAAVDNKFYIHFAIVYLKWPNSTGFYIQTNCVSIDTSIDF